MTAERLSHGSDDLVGPCGSEWLMPDFDALSEAFGAGDARVIASELKRHLAQPAMTLIHRPSKSLRAQLVMAGYEIARASTTREVPTEAASRALSICMQAIEFLHVGSLIIDDIQDGSTERRGGAAVHQLFGTASALNAGNWLYFWPLRLLERAGFDSGQAAELHRHYHATLDLAHCGQGLDVGVRIADVEQGAVKPICDFIIRGKTGSLTALALVMGGIVAGGRASLLDTLKAFGIEFGVALQRFDDLGNARGTVEPAKKWEDLIARRPSYIWSVASELDAASYAAFSTSVAALPDGDQLETWFAATDFFRVATDKTSRDLEAALERLDASLGAVDWSQAKTMLLALSDKVRKAYG